jgi:DNA mismatch endonuclease (patch repair protein)
MADVHSQQVRSFNMSRIRSSNTKPEMIVRSCLHRMGYRFRLHRKELPGKPDIVLPKHRKIILVHGCFWHGHGCKVGGAKPPSSNESYWADKLRRNAERDERHRAELMNLGWEVHIVWECSTQDREKLTAALSAFLSAEEV